MHIQQETQIDMENMIAARFEDMFENMNPRNQMAMVSRIREIFAEQPAIPDSEGGWLFRCAKAAALVGIELLGRLEQLEDRDKTNTLRKQITQALGVGSEDLEIRSLALYEAMTALARESRELHLLLCLRFWLGKTLDETARAMGLSVPAVRERLKKAFAFLRHQLEVL